MKFLLCVAGNWISYEQHLDSRRKKGRLFQLFDCKKACFNAPLLEQWSNLIHIGEVELRKFGQAIIVVERDETLVNCN